MLKIFKSVDEKLKDIGFTKINDNDYRVSYVRYVDDYKYTQVLEICHKKSGRHLIQSYDKDLFDTKGIGNTGVGLTYYETKLALKKMKQKGWDKGR